MADDPQIRAATDELVRICRQVDGERAKRDRIEAHVEALKAKGWQKVNPRIVRRGVYWILDLPYEGQGE